MAGNNNNNKAFRAFTNRQSPTIWHQLMQADIDVATSSTNPVEQAASHLSTQRSPVKVKFIRADISFLEKMRTTMQSPLAAAHSRLFVYFSTFENYANKNLYEDNFARASDAAQNQIDLLQKMLAEKHGVTLRLMDKTRPYKNDSTTDSNRIVLERETQRRHKLERLYPPSSSTDADDEDNKLAIFPTLYNILAEIHEKVSDNAGSKLSAKERRSFRDRFLDYFKGNGCDENGRPIRPSSSLPEFLQLYRKDVTSSSSSSNDADDDVDISGRGSSMLVASQEESYLERVVGPKLQGTNGHGRSIKEECQKLKAFWYYMNPFNTGDTTSSLPRSVNALGIPVGEDARDNGNTTPFKKFDDSFHERHPHKNENPIGRLTDYYQNTTTTTIPSPEVLFSRSLAAIEKFVQTHADITTVYFFTLSADEDNDAIEFDFGAMGSSHYTRHNQGPIEGRIKGLIQRLKNKTVL